MKLPFQLVGLAVITLLATIYAVLMASSGLPVSSPALFFHAVAFAFAITSWVERDRHSRHVSEPLSYSAFVFFLWPIAVPYYLYQTRRWKGLLPGAGLWLLFYLPYSIGAAVIFFA